MNGAKYIKKNLKISFTYVNKHTFIILDILAFINYWGHIRGTSV